MKDILLNNIYRLIKIVLEEYGLINKIFAIDFDNASASTASLLELEKVCKSAFGGKIFIKDVLVMF